MALMTNAESAALELRCPHCDGRSYGGGSRPRVRDALVYRRRLCLAAACGRDFVTVTGVLTERLALALEEFHDRAAAPSLSVALDELAG